MRFGLLLQILDFDTKSLRDTRALLDTCPLSEALQFVEVKPFS